VFPIRSARLRRNPLRESGTRRGDAQGEAQKTSHVYWPHSKVTGIGTKTSERDRRIFGFSNGRENITGVWDGHKLRAKIRYHFELRFKDRCPQNWEIWRDVTLEYSETIEEQPSGWLIVRPSVKASVLVIFSNSAVEKGSRLRVRAKHPARSAETSAILGAVANYQRNWRGPCYSVGVDSSDSTSTKMYSALRPRGATPWREPYGQRGEHGDAVVTQDYVSLYL
jgi:hypothetical protein